MMRSDPWRRRDASVLGVGLLLGALSVLLAWRRTGTTADGGEQLAWLNVGVIGVIAAAFGAALWVRGGRRAVRRRRAALLAGLAPAGSDAAELPVLTDVAVLPVATDRCRRYHRPGCALAAGRAATPAPREEHEAAGRAACEVCHP